MRILSALLCVSVAAGASAAEPRTDQILIQGNKQGSQTVATEADGSVRSEYSYNDRGRGDHVVATWKLNAAGIPIDYTGTGNDYMKAPVEEHFTLEDGKATWKNRTESGETAAERRGVLHPDERNARDFRRARARASEGAEPYARAAAGRRSAHRRGWQYQGRRRQAHADRIPHHRARVPAGVDLARRGRLDRRQRVELVLGPAVRHRRRHSGV